MIDFNEHDEHFLLDISTCEKTVCSGPFRSARLSLGYAPLNRTAGAHWETTDELL